MVTTLTALILALQVLAIVEPVPAPVPAPSTSLPSPAGPQSQSSSPSVTNVTNVFPQPDQSLIVDTEGKAAPVILDSGLRSIDKDAGKNLSQLFQLALKVSEVRKDMILLPAVIEINHNLERIVLYTIGLAIGALALWGIIGQYVGSDGAEGIEALKYVPLWCVLALSTLGWYAAGLDLFSAVAGVIATSAHGAFGPVMREDFWSNVGLGAFSLLIGLVMLWNLAMFAVQLFANSAFLAFAGAVAPVFVFLKVTPWTSKWGDNWFRMVPGTAGDLLAMLTVLVIGAASLDHVTGDNYLQTIGMTMGLLFCMPMIRRLFGLEANSVGSRFLSSYMLMRAIRGSRGGGAPTRAAAAGAGGATGAAAASPSAPTRAPRWGTGATGKGPSGMPGPRLAGARP